MHLPGPEVPLGTEDLHPHPSLLQPPHQPSHSAPGIRHRKAIYAGNYSNPLPSNDVKRIGRHGTDQ